VRITAKTLTLDGRITADGVGGRGSCGSYPFVGGGGAGGSVWIEASHLAGSGTISARGGYGASCTTSFSAGGGGGGRMAVYYNTTTWTVPMFVSANVSGGPTVQGATNSEDGQTGTAAFIDEDNDTIFITGGFRWQEDDYSTNAQWFNWTNLTMQDAMMVSSNVSDLSINASETFNMTRVVWNASVLGLSLEASVLEAYNLTMYSQSSNGSGYHVLDADNIRIREASFTGITNMTGGNITLSEGSVLNSTGFGYSGGLVSQDGNGPGGGAGGYSAGGAGGYGGSGGGSSGGLGSWYGSSFNAFDLGSGGGGSNGYSVKGGDAGGSVMIKAEETLSINAKITADGVCTPNPSTYWSRYGGSGSGGSIHLEADNISGTYSLRAMGGWGYFYSSNYYGYGGGGGRIVVRYNETDVPLSDFISSNASGGQSYTGDGLTGTMALIDEDDGNLFITGGFRWQEDDYSYNPLWFNWTNLTVQEAILVRSNVSDLSINASDTLEITNATWMNYGCNLTLDAPRIEAYDMSLYSQSSNGDGYHLLNSDAMDIRASNIVGITNMTGGNITLSEGSVLNSTGFGYSGGLVGQDGNGPGGGAGGYQQAGGGGYGGMGAYPIGGDGWWYGSSFKAFEIGSGGGGSNGYSVVGGDAGGSVIIKAENLIINATAIADGKPCPNAQTYWGRYGGSGSGGSVHIEADNVSGTYSLYARGGDGFSYSGTNYGGGGGGGRIVVIYNKTDVLLSDFISSETGGGHGSSDGMPGTMALIDEDDGTIFITGGFRWQEDDYITNPQLFNWTNLTVFNATWVRANMTSISLEVSDTYNSTLSTWNNTHFNITIEASDMHISNSMYLCGNSTSFIASNITMDSGSEIRANGTGYSGGNVGQSGSGPGAGRYVTSTSYGPAAGHGGWGGGPSIALGKGNPYGSSFNPGDMGSGGAGANSYLVRGGSGGGSVSMTASDRLVMEGLIDVEGTTTPNPQLYWGRYGGSGSGGSVYIAADEILGLNRISARGGNGYYYSLIYYGYGGGGGRVVIRYNTTNLSLSDLSGISVGGGEGYPGDGNSGTMAFLDEDDNALMVTSGFRFQDNDATNSEFNFTYINATDATLYINATPLTINTREFEMHNCTLSNDTVPADLTINTDFFRAGQSVANHSGRLAIIYNESFYDAGANYTGKGFSLSLENRSWSRLSWTNGSLGTLHDLGQNTLLEWNMVFVNSTEVPAANATANITLYQINTTDLGWTSIEPKWDPADNGSFVACPAGICEVIGYDSANTVYRYNVTQFTSYGSGEPYMYPNMTETNCELNGTDWTNCTSVPWGYNITRVRANCTEGTYQIASVNFTIVNEDDSFTYVNSGISVPSGGYHTLDHADVLINESGNWTVTAVCYDTTQVGTSQQREFDVPYGQLIPYQLVPAANEYNATQYRYFPYKAGVNCTGGECGNVTATLDPTVTSPPAGYPYADDDIILGDSDAWTGGGILFLNGTTHDLTVLNNTYYSSGGYLDVPIDMDTDSNGNFIIVDAGWNSGNTAVLLMNSSTNQITILNDSSSLGAPWGSWGGLTGISIDQNGDYILSGGDTNFDPAVYKMDKNTYDVVLVNQSGFMPLGSGDLVYGIDIDSNGDYIVCGGDDTYTIGSYVARVDKNTLDVTILNYSSSVPPTSNALFSWPIAMKIDKNGDYVIGDTNNAAVYKMDHTTNAVTLVNGATLSNPSGVTVNSNNDYIVSDNSNVDIYNVTTSSVTSINNSVPPLLGPLGLEAISVLAGAAPKGTVSMSLGATPFYTTSDNPRYPWNLTCLEDMRPGDFCEPEWTVNATGAGNSSYNFTVIFSSAEAGVSSNTSSPVNVTILEYFDAPAVTNQVFINSTNGNNYTTEDLYCWAEAEDAENATLTAHWQWWVNGTLNETGNTTVSNGTLELLSVIGFGNTSVDDEWNCSVIMEDDIQNESSWNNATLTVLLVPNTPPSFVSVKANSTSGSNRTSDSLQCWAEGTDPESPTLTFHYQWWNGSALFSSGSATVPNATLGLVSTLSSANTAKGDNWNCSVLLDDGFVNDTSWRNATMAILNTPPAISNPLASVTAYVGEEYTYDFNANDADLDDGNDNLTWTDNTVLFAIDAESGLMNHTPQASEIGSYSITVTATDESSGTGQDSFTYIVMRRPKVVPKNFTVGLKINSTNNMVYVPGAGAKPVTQFGTRWSSPPHWYMASYLNGVLYGLVHASGKPEYIELTQGSSSHTMSLNNGNSGKTFLVFTKGDWKNIEEKIGLIEAGEFLSKISPSFAYGLGLYHPVKTIVEPEGMDILNELILNPGTHEISIEYPHSVGGKPAIYINRSV